MHKRPAASRGMRHRIPQERELVTRCGDREPLPGPLPECMYSQPLSCLSSCTGCLYLLEKLNNFNVQSCPKFLAPLGTRSYVNLGYTE